MWILLTLALGITDGGYPAAPAGEFGKPGLAGQASGWFGPRTKPFGSSVRIAPARGGEIQGDPVISADPAAINCTIRVLKADPGFDARIVRPAPPDLDPKMVRPSPCRK